MEVEGAVKGNPSVLLIGDDGVSDVLLSPCESVSVSSEGLRAARFSRRVLTVTFPAYLKTKALTFLVHILLIKLMHF